MGPFSDRYGRKTSALIFCGVYVVSCLCKNVGSFSMLVAGRIFGGVGTSLLYTAFESWAVYSLDESGLEEDQKSRLFALATFGNAMSAVLAGLITYPLNEECVHPKHSPHCDLRSAHASTSYHAHCV
jgi:MFS family permease